MDNEIHEIARFLTGREENGWDFTYAKKLCKGKWVLVVEKNDTEQNQEVTENESN